MLNHGLVTESNKSLIRNAHLQENMSHLNGFACDLLHTVLCKSLIGHHTTITFVVFAIV